MCLDAHAHGMRVDHDIFHQPHAVELTLEERETPSSYRRPGLGETMTMWRVQTEGYKDGTDQLIGIVSSDKGFLDSPDTEWISSGVNTKGSRAVALGRHGNFFHWGFAASPTYLTDEAQLVFINAIHYIARFDGHAPIARKRQGALTRETLLDAMESITDKAYAKTLARHADWVKEHEARLDELRARAEAGETLTDHEVLSLERPMPAPPDRFDYVKRLLPENAWLEIADDPKAVRDWVEENWPYLRPGEPYQFAVDEEAKSLEIGNARPDFIERLILIHGIPEFEDLAQTLLERYTERPFTTTLQWEGWQSANRGRLFFTEAGGYLWLVDTTDGAGPERFPEVEAPPAAQGPLALKATLVRHADGGLEHVVEIDIRDGWHAYDRVPEGSAYAPLTLELELPPGIEQDGEWVRPLGFPSPEADGLTVYEGAVSFRFRLKGQPPVGASQVVCRVNYQACEADRCLKPATETVRWILGGK